MKPSGGSELLYNNLIKNLGTGWQEKANLILSVCDPSLLEPNKINILWQHLACNQEAVINMQYPEFVNSVDHFVYVSNWQQKHFSDRVDISQASNTVIRNAIDPIEFKEKPQGKIKLIYTSMPNRGLDILLDAYKLVRTPNTELTVFSSNIIYGKGFKYPGTDYLLHRCKTEPGIVYRGYAVNKAVRMALQQSHILAYPSTYEETSCLAAIEAGASGCQIVTTEYGALPETCENWPTYIKYSPEHNELVENYAETLSKVIDNYDPTSYALKEQSRWFNEQYSWANRTLEWKEFFNKICAQ